MGDKKNRICLPPAVLVNKTKPKKKMDLFYHPLLQHARCYHLSDVNVI
jgi:hypothetical protein